MKHSARQYGTIRSSLICASIAALGFVAAACDSSTSSNTGSASGVGAGFSANFTLTSVNGVTPGSFSNDGAGNALFGSQTLTIIGVADPGVASLQITLNGASSTYPVSSSNPTIVVGGLTNVSVVTPNTLDIVPLGANGQVSGSGYKFDTGATFTGIYAANSNTNAPTIVAGKVTNSNNSSTTLSGGASITLSPSQGSFQIAGTFPAACIAGLPGTLTGYPCFIKSVVQTSGVSTTTSISTTAADTVSGIAGNAWETAAVSMTPGTSSTFSFTTLDGFGNTSPAVSVTFTTGNFLIQAGGGIMASAGDGTIVTSTNQLYAFTMAPMLPTTSAGAESQTSTNTLFMGLTGPIAGLHP